MNTHTIQLSCYHPFASNETLCLGTAGSHGNEQLKITLGEGWEGLTVQVIFHPCQVAVQLPADGLLVVPWEATAKALTSPQGRIVFQGFNADRLVNSTDLAYMVESHSSTTGRDEKPYTPGVVESFLNGVAADKEEILAAAASARQSEEDVAASAAAAAGSASRAASSAQQATQALQQAEKDIQAAQKIAVSAVASEGDTQAQRLQAFLPAPTADRIGQTPTVNGNGDGYLLAGPYCPLDAAIRPTANGSPAVCENSIGWRFQGLNIYGKSAQDSTPSPDHPVPIVSAGQNGSIVLRITDGAGQSQSVTVSTPSSLLGVPVTSGGNYTDASGQQWIADTIDFNAKQLISRNIFIRVNDYLNSLAKSTNQKGNTYFITISGVSVLALADNGTSRDVGIFCNYFVSGDSYSDKIAFDIVNILTDAKVQNIRFNFGSALPTLEDAKAWFSAHEVFVVYPLAAPIIIPLSDQELDAYRSLTTYSGTTVVSTPEPVAGIEAHYVADGTAWVESKLAALTASAAQAQGTTPESN